MSQAGPIVICTGVSLSLGGREILRGVDIEIPAGDFLPVLGANGSGKTTLARAIIGLVSPTRGSIALSLPPGGLVGYSPQAHTPDPLFPLSVAEIVAMGLQPKQGLWRRLRPEQRLALDGLLAEVGLAEHRDKHFRELSGGLKRRTLLARALAGSPALLVLDEPGSELDERSEEKLLASLRGRTVRDGTTVIFVHHGAELALRLSGGRHILVEGGTARLIIPQDRSPGHD